MFMAVSKLKTNTIALTFQLPASISYLFLYLQGIGYPIALSSVAIFVVRIIFSFPVLIKDRKDKAAQSVGYAGLWLGGADGNICNGSQDGFSGWVRERVCIVRGPEAEVQRGSFWEIWRA